MPHNRYHLTRSKIFIFLPCLLKFAKCESYAASCFFSSSLPMGRSRYCLLLHLIPASLPRPPPPLLRDPVNAPGGGGTASSASPLEAPVWICLTRPSPAMDAHIHEGWRGREREGATFNLPKLIEIPISCYNSSLTFFIISFIPQQTVLFNVRFIRSYW